MFLKVAEDGAMTLEDSENFESFSIVPDRAGMTLPESFHDIAEDAGEGRFWLEADAVVRFSKHVGNPKWEAQFWEMLAEAEPHGYADLERRLVKAHLEPPT